jgi:hypothetical protein
MHPLIRRGAAAALALCVIVLASCLGPKEERLPETGATLEGTITYGSETIHFAQIQAMGDGKSAIGRIGEDGRYRIENVPLGDVTIGVNTAAAKGEFMSMIQSRANKGPESKGKANVSLPKFVDVPSVYYNPDKSGLKTTIQKGTNTYDVKIPR